MISIELMNVVALVNSRKYIVEKLYNDGDMPEEVCSVSIRNMNVMNELYLESNIEKLETA